MAEMRGCEDVAKMPVWKDTVDGQPVIRYRCPFALLSNETLTIMRLYQFYNKGFLPNKGAVLNQANAFVSAVLVLDEKIAIIQKQQMDEQDAKSKAAARKSRRGGRGRKR